MHRHMLMSVTALALAAAGCGQSEVNQTVSPDLFGERVDIVTPGYLHWSEAGGDTVDPDGDENDIDDNFGDHFGLMDTVTFTDRDAAYATGTVAQEHACADAGNVVRFELHVPRPGQYVIFTRFWRELQDTTNAVVSYQAGDEWVELPPVTDIEHWGGYGNVLCCLIEVPEGQTSVPVRIRATSGRCLIYRVLLGRRREGSPFADDAEPSHPSLHFSADDVAGLREKINGGPPKLAYDYMTDQVTWYGNTLDRGDDGWTPEKSEHHVSRSIAQTAFMYVLTGEARYRDLVTRMMDTVMDWPRDANAIVDQEAGFNILGRGRQLSAMAMAYDWLYDDLDIRTRGRLRRFLDEEANRLYLYNETIVGNTDSNNWDPWIGAGYGMVGVALKDEHAWAGDWVASARRVFHLNLHEAHEDFGYFNSGLIKALDFGISLETATGEDLFATEAEALTALLDYRMMLLKPDRSGYPQFGDAAGSNDPLLALCLATYLRDPLAQWFVHNLSCADAEHVKSWGWNHMLPIAVVTLYDPSLEEQAPAAPRLPLARSFYGDESIIPGLRAVTIMRSGYGSADDAHIALRCGEYGGWHGHPDQGGLVFSAYGDTFVIDRALGAPYGTEKSNFSKSVEAHSTALIDGKGQIDYSGPVFHDRDAGQTGPLLHTPFVDYALADATVAYRKALGKMDHAHRHFVFVREAGECGYLVVVDDLKQDDRLHDFDWLLQTTPNHTIEARAAGHHVLSGKADLHVFTAAPADVEMDQSDHYDTWRTLRLMSLDEVSRGVFVSVLYPTPTGAAAPAFARVTGDGHMGARVGGGDVFLIGNEGSEIDGEGIVTDGRLAAVRRDGDAVRWFLAVDASRVAVGGTEVFRSDVPVTVALNAEGVGCIIAGEPTEVTLGLGDAAPETVSVNVGTTQLSQP